MSWEPLFKAIGLCFLSVIIEAISYNNSGKQWFENLKQPKYSFSLSTWYVVGAVYYILFGIIAYRQFRTGADISSLSIILLISVMLCNGLSNFAAFRYRSLKWYYLLVYPFAVLLLSLIIILLERDIISAILASIYFLWLIYDLYYLYYLWKLNSTKMNLD